MNKRPPIMVMIGKGLLLFLVYPVGFGVGFAIVLQIVIALVEPPFRIPVAMIAFVVYIYAFGRWILRLKPRPLLSMKTWLGATLTERLTQKLNRFLSAVGLTSRPTRTRDQRRAKL